MKYMALFLAIVLMTTVGLSQTTPKVTSDVFIPRTLSAGTLMSGRTEASTYDDTTQGFQVRNWSTVYIGVETATNDSARILLSYAPSKDGVNFSSYVLFDSLSTTGTVGKIKYFVLPADAVGAHSIRLRVYSDTDLLRYSSNPSTTVTTKIVRKHE